MCLCVCVSFNTISEKETQYLMTESFSFANVQAKWLQMVMIIAAVINERISHVKIFFLFVCFSPSAILCPRLLTLQMFPKLSVHKVELLWKHQCTQHSLRQSLHKTFNLLTK